MLKSGHGRPRSSFGVGLPKAARACWPAPTLGARVPFRKKKGTPGQVATPPLRAYVALSRHRPRARALGGGRLRGPAGPAPTEVGHDVDPP